MLEYLSTLQLKHKIVPISHLPDLKKEIDSVYSEWGFLDEKVYQRYLASMQFEAPEEIPDARSIIVIAVPRYINLAIFTYNHIRYTFQIPPTYSRYDETGVEVGELLSEVLNPKGYRVQKTRLPEKLLAVHSGLAYYGRNNISYIPGLGSFYQLVSFYSDLPVEKDEWTGLQILERCNHCNACGNVCPSKAINSDRFMIHAERCLTFFNERPDDFPEWITPQSHNSLIGCMLCQQYCPEDKEHRNKWEEVTQFTEEETLEVLHSDSLDRMSGDAVFKIRKLDLIDTHIDFFNLKRNLKILLQKAGHEI